MVTNEAFSEHFWEEEEEKRKSDTVPTKTNYKPNICHSINSQRTATIVELTLGYHSPGKLRLIKMFLSVFDYVKIFA